MNAPSRRMIGWAAVALVCALAGAAAWRASLPLLAGWAIRRAVEQATGMPATLGTVQLWVYGGELRLGELRVRHPRSGNVVAGWDGAHARLRFGPLLRSRIHIETLEVDRAFVALTSGEADSAGDAIALSAFTGARPAGPALVDVELGHLEIRQARVLLRDAAGPARTIRVEDLTVTLSDLSTGSANAGRQTPLSLSARWEGARMEATGWVKPFAKSPEADVALRLADLDLARLGAWLSPPGGEPLSAAGRRITLRGGRAGAPGGGGGGAPGGGGGGPPPPPAG